jgi:hypothetical protein
MRIAERKVLLRPYKTLQSRSILFEPAESDSRLLRRKDRLSERLPAVAKGPASVQSEKEQEYDMSKAGRLSVYSIYTGVFEHGSRRSVSISNFQ